MDDCSLYCHFYAVSELAVSDKREQFEQLMIAQIFEKHLHSLNTSVSALDMKMQTSANNAILQVLGVADGPR